MKKKRKIKQIFLVIASLIFYKIISFFDSSDQIS